MEQIACSGDLFQIVLQVHSKTLLMRKPAKDCLRSLTMSQLIRDRFGTSAAYWSDKSHAVASNIRSGRVCICVCIYSKSATTKLAQFLTDIGHNCVGEPTAILAMFHLLLTSTWALPMKHHWCVWTETRPSWTSDLQLAARRRPSAGDCHGEIEKRHRFFHAGT